MLEFYEEDFHEFKKTCQTKRDNRYDVKFIEEYAGFDFSDEFMKNVIDFLQNELDKPIAIQFTEVMSENGNTLEYGFGRYNTKPRTENRGEEIKSENIIYTLIVVDPEHNSWHSLNVKDD
jgi:hypothetical protein